MSKRNFVVLGLSLNFIICIVIAVFYFSDKGVDEKAESETTTVAASNQELETTQELEPTIESEMPNQLDTTVESDTIIEPQITTSSEPTTEPESVTEPEPTTEPESVTEPEPTTESESVTEPESATESESVTEPETTTEQATATEPQTSATTVPAYVQGKTQVEIHNSCNVRSQPEVAAEVLGTARVGERYTLIPERCDDHWLAISYQGTVGYMSNKYGSLLP